MIILIGYFIIGFILTMLFLRKDEGESSADFAADVLLSLFAWPLILIATFRDNNKRGRDDE